MRVGDVTGNVWRDLPPSMPAPASRSSPEAWSTSRMLRAMRVDDFVVTLGQGRVGKV